MNNITKAIENSKNNPNNKRILNGDIEDINKFNLSISDRVKYEKEFNKLINERKKVAKEIETTLKDFNSKADYEKSYDEIPEEFKQYMTIDRNYIQTKINDTINELNKYYLEAREDEDYYDDKQEKDNLSSDRKNKYKAKEKKARAEASIYQEYINKIKNEGIIYPVNEIKAYANDVGNVTYKNKLNKYKAKAKAIEYAKANPTYSYSATIDGKTYYTTNKDWLENKYKESNDYKKALEKAEFETAIKYGAIGSSINGGYIFDTNNENYKKAVELQNAFSNGAIGSSINGGYIYDTPKYNVLKIPQINFSTNMSEDPKITQTRNNFNNLLNKKVDFHDPTYNKNIDFNTRKIIAEQFDNERVRNDLLDKNKQIGNFEYDQSKGLVKYDITEERNWLPDTYTNVEQVNNQADLVPNFEISNWKNDFFEPLNLFGYPFYYGKEYLIDRGWMRRHRLKNEKEELEFMENFNKGDTNFFQNLEYPSYSIPQNIPIVSGALNVGGDLVKAAISPIDFTVQLPSNLLEMGTYIGTNKGRKAIWDDLTTINGATETILGTWLGSKFAQKTKAGEIWDKADIGEKPIDFVYENTMKAKDWITGKNKINEIDMDIAKRLAKGEKPKFIIQDYMNAKKNFIDQLDIKQASNPNFINYIKERLQLISKNYINERIDLVKNNPYLIEQFKYNANDFVKDIPSKKVGSVKYVELDPKLSAKSINTKFNNNKFDIEKGNGFAYANPYNNVFDDMFNKNNRFKNKSNKRVRTNFNEVGLNEDYNELGYEYNNPNEIGYNNGNPFANENINPNINNNWYENINPNINENGNININVNENSNINANSNVNENINANINANVNENINANVNANFNANQNFKLDTPKTQNLKDTKEVWITEYNNKSIKGFIHKDKKTAIKSGLFNVKSSPKLHEFTIRKLIVPKTTKTIGVKKLNLNNQRFNKPKNTKSSIMDLYFNK